MENANQIRTRLNKEKSNRILKILSFFMVVTSIILGVLIYMKKDQNATFLKEHFNIETSFVETNNSIDKFLSSLFTFRTNNFGSNEEMVNQNVIYINSEQESYFYTQSNQIPSLSNGIVYQVIEEEDNSFTILVEYDNELIVCYYEVYDPLVKVYDQIKKGDYIASYNQSFKALFKRDGKLISYEEI